MSASVQSPRGYEQVTGLSSAKGLTVPTGANKCLIQVESQAIRWRDDGNDPTSSVGIPVAAGQSFWYEGDLNAFKAIEQSASAKLNVSYYA